MAGADSSDAFPVEATKTPFRIGSLWLGSMEPTTYFTVALKVRFWIVTRWTVTSWGSLIRFARLLLVPNRTSLVLNSSVSHLITSRPEVRLITDGPLRMTDSRVNGAELVENRPSAPGRSVFQITNALVAFGSIAGPPMMAGGRDSGLAEDADETETIKLIQKNL